MFCHSAAKAATLLVSGLFIVPVYAQQSTRLQSPASPRGAMRTPPDCNRNGIDDAVDLASGASMDCDSNHIPDECDVGRVTILAESFETGLPAGWSTTGNSHVTGECAPYPRPDGSQFVYFGGDDVCSFHLPTPREGILALPPIVLPTGTASILLTYNSSYEGEGMDPYDRADVFVNGMLLDHASPYAHLWQPRSVDLLAFSGQVVSIEFRFDATDDLSNDFRGWQVDKIRVSYAIGAQGDDCNLNGVPDTCELDCDQNGIPDECDLASRAVDDCNLNGVPDDCELAGGSSLDCNGNGIPDECDLSLPLPAALDNLQTGHAAITALAPATFYFQGGSAGVCILSRPSPEPFLCGNALSTNLASRIDYTGGGAVVSAAFGPQGAYFTVKHPGLFVLAAAHCAIDRFEVSGAARQPSATVDGSQFSVTVAGQLYTAFIKRTYGNLPSINQILVVPGDGSGITHTYPASPLSTGQVLDGLAGIDHLLYVVVSGYDEFVGGEPLPFADAQEVVEQLLVSVPPPVSADADASGVPDVCE